VVEIFRPSIPGISALETGLGGWKYDDFRNLIILRGFSVLS
jgi:hypothetical protein